jgi:hypothetical protein
VGVSAAKTTLVPISNGKDLGDGVTIHSIDKAWDAGALFAQSVLARFRNLLLHYGDARDVVPHLLKRGATPTSLSCSTVRRGETAFNLLGDCLRISDRIKVPFIHD